MVVRYGLWAQIVLSRKGKDTRIETRDMEQRKIAHSQILKLPKHLHNHTHINPPMPIPLTHPHHRDRRPKRQTTTSISIRSPNRSLGRIVQCKRQRNHCNWWERQWGWWYERIRTRTRQIGPRSGFLPAGIVGGVFPT